MNGNGNIIAVSGTHGTGKTTKALSLMVELKKRNPRKKIGFLSEGAIDCPFPLNKRSTLEGSVLWMFSDQLKRELEASLKYDIVVSDRCVLDPLAYGLVLFGENDTTSGLLLVAREHYRRAYSEVVIMTTASGYCFEDGIRDTDPAFRSAVELRLLELHDKMKNKEDA